MLDERIPYVIDIEDCTGGLNMRDRGVGVPAVAIMSKVDMWEERRGEEKLSLFYYDIGCERGHVLPGEILEDLPNGIVFHAEALNWNITLTTLTYDVFNKRVRAHLNEKERQSIRSQEDVNFYYRRMAGMR